VQQSLLWKGYYPSLSAFSEHISRVVIPHNKATAAWSPAAGLVCHPIIRKAKVIMDAKPSAASVPEDLARV